MIKKIKSLLFSFFKFVYNVFKKTLLKKIPGMATLANNIFRMVWPSVNIIEVQGSKMFIDVNEKNPGLRQTFQAYAMNRIHEETTTNIFRKIIKPSNIFLDLGANIGYFSLLAAKLAGENGKIFSFEPEPKNFYYLQKNIEANNYKNIYPFQKAVSDKNGTTELFICEYDSGHHTIKQYEGVEIYSHGRPTEKKPIKIETISLDKFLEDKVNHVDVIKIDIEGAEVLAVGGMKNILNKNRNIKILMEFFPLFIKKMGDSPEKLIKTLMDELGFNIFVIGHDYSMEKEKNDFIKIRKIEDLMALIKDKEDHLNLYISRETAPLF